MQTRARFHQGGIVIIMIMKMTKTFAQLGPLPRIKMDALDPPVDPKEVGWVDRYHKHLRRRAAGKVCPIKTIPRLHTTPT
jgi:hypothetical protein